MIQKGIIEEIINRYQMRVRIPVYHKIKDNSNATPTSDLPIAYVNNIPGIIPDYKVDDIVLVSFENDDVSSPIVTGLLFREEVLNKKSDVNSDRLEVKNKAVLPKNTTIDGQSLSKFIASAGSGISDVYSIGPEPPADTQLIWIDTSVDGNPTLKVYDKETKSWFSTIGQAGKSAYQQAVDGGYTKSEEIFMSELNSIGEKQQKYIFPTTIDDSSWSYNTDTNCWTNVVSVPGLLENDTPIISLSNGLDDINLAREWNRILNAYILSDNTLVVSSSMQPTLDIPISILVLRP